MGRHADSVVMRIVLYAVLAIDLLLGAALVYQGKVVEQQRQVIRLLQRDCQ